MIPKHGTRPTTLDRRDYSFHGTFGTINADLIAKLPTAYNVDAGLTMPDQNADGNPYSCTAYTTCDLGTDQDKVIYSPEYTYMKTLVMQNLPPETNGSDIRPALKSAKVYGLLPKASKPVILDGKGEDFTAQVSVWPLGLDAISGLLEHRKGDYFNVYDDGGLDWYDSFKSALWINRDDKRGISLGTPWLWNSAPRGFLTEYFTYNGPSSVGWHNWKICGWKVIDGQEYLIGKPWCGRNYGDNGFVYVSRATINKVMAIRGSVAFTLKDATEADIKTIKIGMIETILYYLKLLLGKPHLN